MKLYRLENAAIIEAEDGKLYSRPLTDWDAYINRDDLYNFLQYEIAEGSEAAGNVIQNPLTPLKSQEVWAAGVTYLKSKNARMEESKESGGGSFYDKVYNAERPEIFFKATAQRTVAHKEPVRIRRDSDWNVPEPELTLFITSSGKIVAYTIGNDMSSRSIEGENPLYLPQAKTYEGCAALGPCLYVPQQTLPKDTLISIDISRNDAVVFTGSVSTERIKRPFTELVSFLYRECSFRNGCFLMTGTGIVPGNDFTLQSNDLISISIEHIGTLINSVA